MEKDLFGLSLNGIERRIQTERERADRLRGEFAELIRKIRESTESDKWERVIIFNSSAAELGALSYADRAWLAFMLRRHPNIISQLSHKESRNLADSRRPAVFKFVSAQEKVALGINSFPLRLITRPGDE